MSLKTVKSVKLREESKEQLPLFSRRTEYMEKNEKSKGPRVVSLFSGAGGMDLGFIMAGHKIIFAIESDKWAYETYKYNLGNHVVLADIRKYPSEKIPDYDIVIGGPPCQGVSVANPKRAVDDVRNSLMYEFVRVVRDKLPKMFVMENVPGLCNIGGYETKEDKKKKEGRFFKALLQEFSAAGYQVDWHRLNAADYGVPQNRWRIFVFGQRLPAFIKNGKLWIDDSIKTIMTMEENKKGNTEIKVWKCPSEES